MFHDSTNSPGWAFCPPDLIPVLARSGGGYSRRVHRQRVAYQKEN